MVNIKHQQFLLLSAIDFSEPSNGVIMLCNLREVYYAWLECLIGLKVQHLICAKRVIWCILIKVWSFWSKECIECISVLENFSTGWPLEACSFCQQRHPMSRVFGKPWHCDNDCGEIGEVPTASTDGNNSRQYSVAKSSDVIPQKHFFVGQQNCLYPKFLEGSNETMQMKSEVEFWAETSNHTAKQNNLIYTFKQELQHRTRLPRTQSVIYSPYN